MSQAQTAEVVKNVVLVHALIAKATNGVALSTR
jgi:hypothetical protein